MATAPNLLVNRPLEETIRTPGRTPSPQPTHLGVPGQKTLQRTLREAGSGYVAPKFEGKEKQMDEVIDIVQAKNFIPEELVENEVEWLYEQLGIDDMYFSTESVDTIVSHVHSLYAAKIAAYARDDKKLDMRLDKEATDHAVYIDTSRPGVSTVDGPHYEQRIDQKYLNDSKRERAYRVETFRSSSQLPGSGDERLRCYFVYQCDFVNPDASLEETQLEVIGDKRFLQKATNNTKEIYQEVIRLAVERSGPVIEKFDIEGQQDKRLVIAYKQGSAIGFFSALSDLSPAHHVSRHPPIESSIHQIMKEVSLLYCIPQNKFQMHFASGRLSLQETIYAHCCWVFTGHFLNRLGNEFTALANILSQSNGAHAELLSKIKRRLRNETFTWEYLIEIINQYPELIRALYLDFANAHYVQRKAEEDDFLPTLSYLRLKIDKVLDRDEIQALISKSVANEHHAMVLKAFWVFNSSILKTNFYTPTKVALSFRLDPSFLPATEYPQPLYGMFIVIGSEFRGFHLRFKDVARGGIRIVKSRSREAYSINARSLFDENYNLASTQQRKNKDIPEGGSKGAILLDGQHQDKARVSFEKYIDSILDLLLPPSSPGIKDPIVDNYGKEEILFMGPDENTADLVDWATSHARRRGATFWKSFFTGKSPKLGGIPHDAYGMTSLSVREYVLGIYRKLKLDPSKITKLQTGGPDGDLGSNEILLSNERYSAIVDGSGVLVDPAGIDHDELVKLARSRSMISSFDIKKLSNQGYRVLVDETNIKLPSGEEVSNGTMFRNTFHLRPEKYDTFVPCGGRPESIDISSVSSLLVDGKPTISYLVEGANLFLTQEARLRLEEAGVVIYKDASANKGGVTSSSLEVLASLAFDEEGFITNMCVSADGQVPSFYKAYVEQVQQIIKRNASLEFEAIWREHEQTGIHRSILSDKISNAITKLDEELQQTELWHDVALRRSVLGDALPNLLIEKIGFDTIVSRVGASLEDSDSRSPRIIYAPSLAAH